MNDSFQPLRSLSATRVCQRCFSPAARPVGVMDHGARCIPSRATHTRPLHINPSFSRRTHHTRTPHLSAHATVCCRWRRKMAPTAAAACVPGAVRRSRRRMHTPFTPPEPRHRDGSARLLISLMGPMQTFGRLESRRARASTDGVASRSVPIGTITSYRNRAPAATLAALRRRRLCFSSVRATHWCGVLLEINTPDTKLLLPGALL